MSNEQSKTKPTKRRLIDPDDLVGVAELAEMLSALGYKVERSHITTWISRREDVEEDGRVTRKANGFPEAFRQFRMGGAYLWSEVLPWVEAKYGRKIPAQSTASE